MMPAKIFIAGATGYIGAPLAKALLQRGHTVRALARPGSEGRVPGGCTIVRGTALDSTTYLHAVAPADTFVHLIGTPHPAPWKERQFIDVDLRSLTESVAAAQKAGIEHFVFVSVAHPAPVMKAYIRVRAECERALAASGLRTTIVRPWYVLGPGHWWPAALAPFYRLGEWMPGTRSGALRLGLVTRAQMVAALVAAIENPPSCRRVLEVPDIRGAAAPAGPTPPEV